MSKDILESLGKKSTINNMKDQLEFFDKVNVKKAKYLFNLNLQQFKHTFWRKLEVDENGRGYELKTFYNEVRKFCGEVIRNKEKDEDFALIKRKYRFSDNKNGRIFSCGFGVQSLQGNLRKFLTGDYLLDIDIKNCHPNILYKLVLEYNENHDDKLNYMYLENYIKNREQILKENDFDKMSFLICLNSDKIQSNKKNKGFYTKNPFLIGFHNEKNIIFNKIIYNTDYVKKYDIVSTNDNNHLSSRMNKLFCIKENDIIQCVMKSKICVPMFDGFMFPIEEKEKYDYLLEEDKIIQWDYKENLIDIDMLDFDEGKSKDYDTLKLKFEEDSCLILTKPIVFLKKLLNEENKLVDVYYDEKNMTTLTKPLKILNEEGKEQSFFNAWLEDEKRRSYNFFNFNPYVREDDTPEHIYNTFNSFDVSEVNDIEEPEWFKEFILTNLANDNKESYEYILNYLAHTFQYPSLNVMVALVLRGNSGIGKDTLIEIIELMMGKKNNYVHRTTDISDILPQQDGFNSELKNKLLIQFNEVEGKKTIDVKEAIKDHITRTTNNIKEKYVNPYKQRNLAPVIFCSNNNSPVQFQFDERRFAMFKCGEKNKGDRKYWKELYENINDINKLNNLYSWLLRRDISDWDAVEERPMTKAYMIAISNAIPHHIKWLKSLFIDEDNLNVVFDNKKDYYFANTKTVYKSFNYWCQENHLLNEGQFKSQSFKRLLQDIDGITFDKSIKINKTPLKKVVFEKTKILNELNKYKFSIDDDDDILDLDTDEEE